MSTTRSVMKWNMTVGRISVGLTTMVAMGMCLGASSIAVAEPGLPVLEMTVAQAPDKNGSHRPKASAGSPQSPIELDFDDTPLLEILSSIGALTGRNFEVDPALKNEKVTVISHHPLPPQMAYEVLEAIFKTRGWVMEEMLGGELVKVYKSPLPDPSKLEIFKYGEAHLGFDNSAIHIIQPKYILASEAAEVLKKVGSKNVESIVFESTNTLIMIDTADGIRNMYELLAHIDIEGFDVETEIFELQYTRAEALMEQLNEVLLGDSSGAKTRPGQNQPRNVARTSRTPSKGVSKATTVVGSSEEVLRMVTDERLNALIVVATANMMEQVRSLIKRLDTKIPTGANNIHYVPLLHSNSESVLTVLEAVTSSTVAKGGKGQSDDTDILVFEKKVVITRDEDNNALVIIASPQDFKELEALIEKMDVPRQQVNVEAVIMEVTLKDDFSLNVESAALDQSSFFALSNVTDIANVLTGGPGTVTGPGGTIGIIDGTTDVVLNGVTTQVPNIPFLLRALEELTDLEILSRPNLLMKNNTEGKLVAGSEIGLPTSRTDINPNSGFQNRSSIQRRDVGINLTVTPQINEGGFVTMVIEVESSNVDDSASLNTDTGAVITKSNVKSEIVVKDGQTGIIGGLIRDSHTRRKAQVPLLGDIPILGYLFKSRSNVRSKQNLVVLVTPHIVTREGEMAKVVDEGLRKFHSYEMDAMFEKGGLIKKTKAKYKARSKTRPTDPYKPDSDGGHVFNQSNTLTPIETPAEETVN